MKSNSLPGTILGAAEPALAVFGHAIDFSVMSENGQRFGPVRALWH
ncbi:hypothetical protein QQ056_00200 [Oscillatoria laete-virens NRMC-F 0139]|nr:hypothetical protein [Oscillatoria laete-virens]MDL5052000.1 hypothetical protein [Oscillatoria laete-virens NRMC-F 0139]